MKFEKPCSDKIKEKNIKMIYDSKKVQVDIGSNPDPVQILIIHLKLLFLRKLNYQLA